MSKGLNKKKLKDDLTIILTPDTSKKASSITPENVAEKIANAIHDYITSGKVETSVTVNLSGQQFGTPVGPAIAIPGSIASGDGVGEIK